MSQVLVTVVYMQAEYLDKILPPFTDQTEVYKSKQPVRQSNLESKPF